MGRPTLCIDNIQGSTLLGPKDPLGAIRMDLYISGMTSGHTADKHIGI